MLGKRIISTLLAVLMLVSSFALVIQAEEVIEYTKKTNNQKATINYLTGTTLDGEVISTPEQKLATMDRRYAYKNFEIYVDAYSGEVAVKNVATGDILFTNPYTMADAYSTNGVTGKTGKVADATKYKLMSQLIVNWTEIKTGTPSAYGSFEYAAMRGGQIKVSNINGGIRVEYSIGKEATKLLLPRVVLKEDFETKVLEPFYTNVYEAEANGEIDEGYAEFYYNQLKAAYDEMPFSELANYAVTVDLNPDTDGEVMLYVMRGEIDTEFAEKQMNNISLWIDEFTDYSFDDLEEDHAAVGYEAKEDVFPVFKMALEYTLDAEGLSVKLPANGLRFDETLYQLENIEILPFMGAGSSKNTGYTFFPDGSGALFRFEDVVARNAYTSATGKIYGVDYAYHTIESTIKNQEVLRYPVYGLVEDDAVTGYTRGFVAIVEEGDAMMDITTEHAINTHNFNAVKMKVYPRPKDSYRMSDAVSQGSSDMWTVVSSRKFTGDFKIRYIMLTDPELAQEKGVSGYYDASYVGMAKAYREYLVKTGVLRNLTEADVQSDIPLFVETLGAMDTTERFLSIPFDVMTALTSFADIQTMYEELSAEGVSNINFVLTGYTKGGLLAPTIPYHLNWENCVEEDLKFEELVAYAKDNNFGIYPDFDFVFAPTNTAFDGLTLSKHAAKTIDDRYTSKREYSATYQTRISYFELAISPAYFSHFYEKLTDNYLEYEPIGISASTLGTFLNSDFDEEEPYNREDSKEFTAKAFSYLDTKYSKVMTSNGNAYSWKYVDYIKDIALDSSRYSVASDSVPFLGMVLHGYVQYAGTPINMEGNTDYAMLKAIENGASLNFILAYRNTEKLKDFEYTSQYYSVRYDIWFTDVVSLYNEMNEVMKDIQTSVIVDHRFINGTRIPDEDEILGDAEQAIKDAIAYEEALREANDEAERQMLKEARDTILDAIALFENSNDSALAQLRKNYMNSVNKLNEARGALDMSKSETVTAVITAVHDVCRRADALVTYCDNLVVDYEEAVENLAFLQTTDAYEAQEMDRLASLLDACRTQYDNAIIEANTISNDVESRCKVIKDLLLKKTESYRTAFNTALKAFNDAYKTASENSKAANLKALNEAMTELYAKADALINYCGQLLTGYEGVVAEYDALAEVAGAGNVMRRYLNALINAFAASYDAVKGIPAELTAEVNALYAKANDLFAAADYKASNGAYVNPLTVVEEETEDDVVADETVEAEDTRYDADSGKIVYEEYANGKAFILNFNNYTVKTVFNGVIYIIDAYDYVIINA